MYKFKSAKVSGGKNAGKGFTLIRQPHFRLRVKLRRDKRDAATRGQLGERRSEEGFTLAALKPQ
jgi:hypothetical protein